MPQPRKVPVSFGHARSIFRVPILASLCLAAGLQCFGPPALAQQATPPVTAPTRPDRDDGQWLIPARDYANTRYSALDQINAGNAKDLRLAFTFSTGVTHGHEAAPLVVGDTMYIVTPWPNILYALDLTRPGAPMRWQFQPKPLSAAQGVACCDVVNRGASYANGKIFFNTLDDQTVAVDAKTGKEVWKTRVGDINLGESITMAPLVVKDKVLVGNSGGEFGVRGWLTALDANTGKIAWRAYSTGPDSEALIGSEFKPFYPQEHRARTWASRAGRRRPGRSAEARCGASSPTIRR
jgi:glucose dehydrogenase